MLTDLARENMMRDWSSGLSLDRSSCSSHLSSRVLWFCSSMRRTRYRRSAGIRDSSQTGPCSFFPTSEGVVSST